jgi:hypothetical protein
LVLASIGSYPLARCSIGERDRAKSAVGDQALSGQILFFGACRTVVAVTGFATMTRNISLFVFKFSLIRACG